MAGTARKPETRYTYDQYQTWPDDERWELINGEAYAQASPTPQHQRVSIRLGGLLERFFKGKPCVPFAAPLDVVLSDDTVMQPDLLVVCRPEQITGRGVTGAPSLVIEIVSPSSFSHDRFLKFKKYAAAGVKEYWIASPEQASIEVFTLVDGAYRLHDGYVWKETVSSLLFPDIAFALTDIFDAPAEGIVREPHSRSTPGGQVD